ncbi:hypothetical protein NDU88_008242, partial [Pleurodeles waltl]
ATLGDTSVIHMTIPCTHSGAYRDVLQSLHDTIGYALANSKHVRTAFPLMEQEKSLPNASHLA